MRSSSGLGYQLGLHGISTAERVVNVASVPQRSPFRYPGGKTWLVPQIRAWLTNLGWKPALLVEPFAGGAIVGLTVAAEHLAERVVLVELDEQVAAVWKTILSDDCEWLVQRIVSFNLTLESLQAELADIDCSVRQMAFRTILRNRTFRGGILAPGSRPIKFGESGKGLLSRWYPGTIAQRIRTIANMRDQITFIQGDGIAAIRQYTEHSQAVFFIDPPYTAGGKKAGARLYSHYDLDHDLLFAMTSRVMGDFLVTYDYAEEVLALAARYGLETKQVLMKSTHHTLMKELLIGRNLNWVW